MIDINDYENELEIKIEDYLKNHPKTMFIFYLYRKCAVPLNVCILIISGVSLMAITLSTLIESQSNILYHIGFWFNLVMVIFSIVTLNVLVPPSRY